MQRPDRSLAAMKDGVFHRTPETEVARHPLARSA